MKFFTPLLALVLLTKSVLATRSAPCSDYDILDGTCADCCKCSCGDNLGVYIQPNPEPDCDRLPAPVCSDKILAYDLVSVKNTATCVVKCPKDEDDDSDSGSNSGRGKPKKYGKPKYGKDGSGSGSDSNSGRGKLKKYGKGGSDSDSDSNSGRGKPNKYGNFPKNYGKPKYGKDDSDSDSNSGRSKPAKYGKFPKNYGKPKYGKDGSDSDSNSGRGKPAKYGKFSKNYGKDKKGKSPKNKYGKNYGKDKKGKSPKNKYGKFGKDKKGKSLKSPKDKYGKPDFGFECRADRDCPQIACYSSPCDPTVCRRGKCKLLDEPDSGDSDSKSGRGKPKNYGKDKKGKSPKVPNKKLRTGGRRKKVTVCHRAAGKKNPYNMVEVDIDDFKRWDDEHDDCLPGDQLPGAYGKLFLDKQCRIVEREPKDVDDEPCDGSGKPYRKKPRNKRGKSVSDSDDSASGRPPRRRRPKNKVAICKYNKFSWKKKYQITSVNPQDVKGFLAAGGCFPGDVVPDSAGKKVLDYKCVPVDKPKKSGNSSRSGKSPKSKKGKSPKSKKGKPKYGKSPKKYGKSPKDKKGKGPKYGKFPKKYGKGPKDKKGKGPKSSKEKYGKFPKKYGKGPKSKKGPSSDSDEDCDEYGNPKSPKSKKGKSPKSPKEKYGKGPKSKKGKSPKSPKEKYGKGPKSKKGKSPKSPKEKYGKPKFGTCSKNQIRKGSCPDLCQCPCYDDNVEGLWVASSVDHYGRPQQMTCMDAVDAYKHTVLSKDMTCLKKCPSGKSPGKGPKSKKGKSPRSPKEKYGKGPKSKKGPSSDSDEDCDEYGNPKSPKSKKGKSPKSPKEKYGKSPKSKKGKSPKSPKEKYGKGPKSKKGKSPKSPKEKYGKSSRSGKSPKSPKEKYRKSPKSPKEKYGKSPKDPRPPKPEFETCSEYQIRKGSCPDLCQCPCYDDNVEGLWVASSVDHYGRPQQMKCMDAVDAYKHTVLSEDMQCVDKCPSAPEPEPEPKTVACTADFKECSDGSFVSRQGDNCEFAACPEPVGCADDVQECWDGSFVSRQDDCDCDFADCPPQPRGCTDDVQECWDGSTVGREGDDCEFAACPSCSPEKETCWDGSTVGREGDDCGFAACPSCSPEKETCWDGSTVGREGDNCEFAACPSCSPEKETCWDGSTVGREGDDCGFAACPSCSPEKETCWDGSTVGREGDNCGFAACPSCSPEKETCWDGSTVGREGDNCGFAACPPETPAPTDAPTDPPTDAPTDSPTDAPTDPPADRSTPAPTESWLTEEQESYGCETAFAYDPVSGTCFSDYKEIDITRWGWAIGCTPDTYSFEMYAGAADCDIEKGTKVGDLEFSWDGSNGYVTYIADDFYKFEQTHFNIGWEPLPRDNKGEYTVAPGQYSVVHDVCENSKIDHITFSGVEPNPGGMIYMIAHAVSCDDF